ncbi:MAG: SDR family oxidoreductase [Acidimicrobiales bacterium]
MAHGLDAVTGAFGYSGRAITGILLTSGRRVRTLTGHPRRAPRDSSLEVFPLDFSDWDALVSSLDGVDTLYKTYWVRFGYQRTTHDQAVHNSETLFRAASRAGVARIVHVSITNPSLDSPFSYFAGKARVERALSASEVPSSIVRPAIVFGEGGVLLNNIAWLLRHSPLFCIGDGGRYKVRPVHVEDLAHLCVTEGAASENRVVNAVGPESVSFVDLIEMIKRVVSSRALLVSVPGTLLPGLAKVLGLVLRDVLLTRDEYEAMAAGLADTDGPATGPTELSVWLALHGAGLGRKYANELARHYD